MNRRVCPTIEPESTRRSSRTPRPANIASRLAPELLALAAKYSGGSPRGELARLADLMLGASSSGQSRLAGDARSDLNCNGSPLQLLLAARSGQTRSRLIVDPCFDSSDPVDRHHRSKAIVATLLSSAPSASRRRYQAMFDAMLPDEPAALRRYPTGTMRLAAHLEPTGASLGAVYVGSGPEHATGWDRACAWLHELIGPAAVAAVDGWRGSCQLFGVGLEGVVANELRAKLYIRLGDHCPPGALGSTPLFGDSALIEFLRRGIEDRGIPRKALTFGVGFSLAERALHDVKIDMCTRGARLSTRAALELVEQQAERLGLTRPDLRMVTEDDAIAGLGIGAVGLGLDRRGRHRLHTYLFQRAELDETKP